jgi:DNA mismatch endonuclease, patch repair protein
VAVFVDSAWWHGHPSRWTPGRLSKWWDDKIERNRQRDATVTTRLRDEGWTVVRLWDFEVERDLPGCVERVRRALASGSSSSR